MGSLTTTDDSKAGDPGTEGSGEKFIQATGPDGPPLPATGAEEDDQEPEYLPMWQLLPVFAAMGLGIFILGLASNLSACRLQTVS